MLSPEGLCRSQEATTPNLTSKTFYPPLGPLEPHKAYLPTPPHRLYAVNSMIIDALTISLKPRGKKSIVFASVKSLNLTG